MQKFAKAEWLALKRANIKSSNLAGLMYFPVTIRHGNDFSGGKQPLKPVHCIFLAAPYRADGGGCGVHRLSGYIERAILEVRSGGQRGLSTRLYNAHSRLRVKWCRKSRRPSSR